MLDHLSDHDENRFFDALEEISVCSDSGLDCPNDDNFDVWVQNPESVEARRSKFFNWLGLDVSKISGNDSEESSDFERDIDRIRNEGRSSMSCFSGDDLSSSGNSTPKVHFARGVENRDGGMAGYVGDQNKEFVSSGSSEFSPVKKSDKNCSKTKKWWQSRLLSFRRGTEKEEVLCKYDSFSGGRIQRVKVHTSGRQCKELSALYPGQSIEAHKGAILTMKFSPDGRFLASAGEDKIVRVWQVTEDHRSSDRDIPDMDPSSVYFTMNQLSGLKPLSSNEEKSGRLRRNSDSACVVLPPKVFRLLEKPLHEFQGHTSEILDLSWSKSNHLLSSSVDKTVRLWRVGNNHCLKVFPHNNYVTCVEFNPVNENRFISGSIDGKVRVWEISLCRVAYWTEIKDIVTAVCYYPDGQGGIIGSNVGSCHFYSITDNQFELEDQIFLHNKKSSGKRITGFQFFPRDPSKVMISCADSQVRIVQGVDVIGKYKATRSTGTFSSANFTSDGKHIILTSEDSSVHIWKCADPGLYRESPHIKKVKSSERFVSNASVAVPWPGIENESRQNKRQNDVFNSSTHHGKSFFSRAHLSYGQRFFQELNYLKGSALWPEEKLLVPSKTSSMHKSEYKFLRTCQNGTDSHTWGMVIVTAGWDGRIRSFHNYGLPVPH